MTPGASLAIADPPYPPRVTVRGERQSRSQRWYGEKPRGGRAHAADCHPAAAEWDDPARHRRLLLDLADQFDGFAIATCSDGLQSYGSLPAGARIMAWIRPNAAPGASRIRSVWEPVIVRPPRWRARGQAGCIVSDALILSTPRPGDSFAGRKPERWTWWVLDALGFEPATDTVVDLFPGSGAVSNAIKSYNPQLPMESPA